MKLSLPSNISKLRKNHAMTQEQLAESLGVTFAAVSKWERGIATPDLALIAQIASLFSVSLDALVGFEMQDCGADAFVEQIRQLRREKRYEEAAEKVEEALLRYPNDFQVVFCAGELYEVAGLEKRRKAYTRRSIDLLERAVSLLPQNANPEISEYTLRRQIAENYISLGNNEKALEILKKYNISGIHNSLIAMIYACYEGYDPKEAAPYLMDAFGDILTSSIRTMTAYANYYEKNGFKEKSVQTVLWLIDLLESVKVDKAEVAYVDKHIALWYAMCAKLYHGLGRKEEAEACLRRSYAIARTFDAAPCYTLRNIKFCVTDVTHAAAYDDLGSTAIAAIECQALQDEQNQELFNLWNRIKEEDHEG